jgi:DNA polymerase/3'-5' exonuclease PolX
MLSHFTVSKLFLEKIQLIVIDKGNKTSSLGIFSNKHFLRLTESFQQDVIIVYTSYVFNDAY